MCRTWRISGRGGSPICTKVDALLDGEIATCDPIRMEVLAGARDERHLDDLRRLLARASVLEVGPADYEDAAALYRALPPRRRNRPEAHRLLIAAVAIRAGTPVLQSVTDFEVLARHTPLHLARP